MFYTRSKIQSDGDLVTPTQMPEETSARWKSAFEARLPNRLPYSIAAPLIGILSLSVWLVIWMLAMVAAAFGFGL
jgi:hypothetical protein